MTSSAISGPEHIYDESFTILEQRWGTCVSYDLEGRPIITSLTRELCLNATRQYLKWLQEGFPTADSSYDGKVGGKL